jgi:hypothetical protein
MGGSSSRQIEGEGRMLDDLLFCSPCCQRGTGKKIEHILRGHCCQRGTGKKIEHILRGYDNVRGLLLIM